LPFSGEASKIFKLDPSALRSTCFAVAARNGPNWLLLDAAHFTRMRTNHPQEARFH
jgi:hypothetical protein